MRQISITYAVLTVAAVLATAALSAQDAPFPVPQYDEVFYCYNRVSGKLIDLERQIATEESVPKALGFAGFKISSYLPGAHSPVRFREGDALEFVFSLPQRVDPHTVQFLVLRVSGNRREFLQMNSNRPSPLGVGTKHDVRERSAVQYEIQNYVNSVYRLTTSKPLTPGEYTLSMPTNNVAFSFGIDVAGSGK